MPLEIQLLEHPTEEERSAILTPLLAHNLANGGDDGCAGITGTPTASTRTG